jgi:peptidoglycan/LPS O-acetylase OafA/YrhL
MPQTRHLPPSRLPSRLPGLDGIRAISILAVLFSHLAGTRHAYPHQPFMGSIGILGVRVFFVLSGFLITFLLLEERKRTGSISLRGFYGRRVRRIFPGFYSYLLAIALLKTAGFLHLPWTDFAISAGFLTDLRLTDWDLGHFWSLSTEEQFYLLWPALLMFAGRPRALKIGLTAVVLTPFLSGVLSKLHFPHLAMLLLSVNAIATGCVLAGMRERLHSNARYMGVLKSRWLGLLAVITLLLASWQGHGVVLLYGITAACIAVLIDRVITIPGGFAASLNWQPMVWLGGMSYSLYVWQQLFLNRYVHNAFTTFPLNLVLTAVCALLSFYLIERPFLCWRNRLKGPALQAEPVLAASR